MTDRNKIIDECLGKIAEQRCQRDTPWDLACTTIYEAVRSLKDDPLDPIQNNCKYGYVLPDRCRYMRHLGCDCGAYPPIEKAM